MGLTITDFLTAWAILGLNLLTPGPNVLNTITTAMGSGRMAGVTSAAAIAPGIGTWCLAMSLGMAVVFRTIPGTEESLTIMAAMLLVYFATRYMRAAFLTVEERAEALKGRAGVTLMASFWRSLSINATNPKALTTWIAILGLFPMAIARGEDIAILALGSALLGAAIHLGYALLFSTPAAARIYWRAAPVINGAVSVFFTGFAIKLVAPMLARAFG